MEKEIISKISFVIHHRNHYNLVVPALLKHQAFETTQRSARCSWHNKMEMTILVDATFKASSEAFIIFKE